LVEVTVVVVIIGVLAAIAIPRISRGSEGAGGAAAHADLAVMRKAIDVYSAEHGGVFPGQNADGQGGAAQTEQALVSQMTKFTDFNGRVSTTRTYPYIFGPYLAKGFPPAPIGAFAGSSSVKVMTTGPTRVSAGNYGWVYNVTTGEIILNTTATEEADIRSKFGLGRLDVGAAN
jgi:type II secretory pathway pseudopilin PulG